MIRGLAITLAASASLGVAFLQLLWAIGDSMPRAAPNWGSIVGMTTLAVLLFFKLAKGPSNG